MYKSRIHIENKMKQVKYTLDRLLRYENKVFIYNGKDQKTGCYPFEISLITFLTFTRSVFQYAHKEIGETIGRPNQAKYDSFISSHPHIKEFKIVRDIDIHQMSIIHQVTLSGESRMMNEDSEEYRDYKKALEEGRIKPKKMKVKYVIGKPVPTTPTLIAELEASGDKKLAEEARNGTTLHKPLEIDGESDIFKLCRKYYDETLAFVEYCIKEGMIS